MSLELRQYWVDLLMDDGVIHGFAEEAFSPESAIKHAMDCACQHGMRPVGADSVTLNQDQS